MYQHDDRLSSFPFPLRKNTAWSTSPLRKPNFSIIISTNRWYHRLPDCFKPYKGDKRRFCRMDWGGIAWGLLHENNLVGGEYSVQVCALDVDLTGGIVPNGCNGENSANRGQLRNWRKGVEVIDAWTCENPCATSRAL